MIIFGREQDGLLTPFSVFFFYLTGLLRSEQVGPRPPPVTVKVKQNSVPSVFNIHTDVWAQNWDCPRSMLSSSIGLLQNVLNPMVIYF